MGIRNTIQLKEDICAGPGKFVIYQREECNESYVAIVHSGTLMVELIVLDKRGNVLQQHELDLDELIEDKPDDIQVLWCDDEPNPVLMIAHTNYLLRVIFDSSTQTWKGDINRMFDQHGWIGSLASTNGYIYTGSNDGIWEIGSQDMLVRSKLGNFSTTVICVSEEYLAVGEEQGDIIIYQGGPNNWSRVEHQLQDNIKKAGCCTSMMFLQEKGEQVLVAGFSSGILRCFLLPTMECLSETAAHIRWITQILPIRGGFVSASEDGYLHLWTIGRCNDPSWDIRYLTSFELKDCMITAAVPFSDLGLLVTAYDRPHIFWITLGGAPSVDYDDDEEPINDEVVD